MEKERPIDVFVSAECQRFQDLLEQQIVDESRFQAEETAFLTSHRGSCADCALFADALASLGETPPDERSNLQSRKNVRALVDRSFARRDRKRRYLLAATSIAALLVLTVAILLTRETRDEHKGDRFEILAGQMAVGGISLPEGALFGGLDETASPISKTALVGAEQSLFVALRQDASLKLLKSSADEVRFELTNGRIAVHLKKDSPLNLGIDLPDGAVEVTGTVFVIDVSDGKSRVDVIEGKVEITRHHNSTPLPEGLSLKLTDGAKAPHTPISADPLLILLGVELPAESVVATKAIEPPELDVEAVAGARSLESDPPQAAKTAEKPKTSRPQPIETVASPEELLRAARACRAAQDWDCAIESYEQLIDKHPNRLDATTALVPLGQILLQHGGRPKAALRNFKNYLKRQQGGPLAPEASWGECSALKAIGRIDDERGCLENFLRAYPSNLNARIARFRLEEL